MLSTDRSMTPWGVGGLNPQVRFRAPTAWVSFADFFFVAELFAANRPFRGSERGGV